MKALIVIGIILYTIIAIGMWFVMQASSVESPPTPFKSLKEIGWSLVWPIALLLMTNS